MATKNKPSLLGRVVGIIEQLLFERDVTSARLDELEGRVSLLDGHTDAGEKRRAVRKAEACRDQRDALLMQAVRDAEGRD